MLSGPHSRPYLDRSRRRVRCADRTRYDNDDQESDQDRRYNNRYAARQSGDHD